MQLKSVKNAVIRQINILCPQDQPKQLTQKKQIILKTYSKKKDERNTYNYILMTCLNWTYI